MNESVKYWIGVAKNDLDVARTMLTGKHYLYVGFMCQQSIEKALKAVIARDCAEGEIPPKIHDLSKLAKKGNIYTLMSEEQKDLLDELFPMNIEARYPEYKEQIAKELSADTCKNLIARTEEMLCWIKEQL